MTPAKTSWQTSSGAAAELGVEPSKVYFLQQVHGTELVRIDADHDRESVLFERGDAIASDDPQVAVGVRTADCVPILVADEASGTVAAIHGGWRGLVAGVIDAGVQVLRETGTDQTRWLAAIGPHISVGAFEVSEDVAAQLVDCVGAESVVERSPGAKPRVNLRQVAARQLESLGFQPGRIDHVEGCTVRDPERFFSYRRSGKASGRHLSAIRPRPRPS